jgi:predicted dehydrogenase
VYDVLLNAKPLIIYSFNLLFFLMKPGSMKPIRIGIIGLSPGAWAANAHLPYLQRPDSKFEIVAVCNSSVESAVKSAKDLNLPGGVRTYGNVQGM